MADAEMVTFKSRAENLRIVRRPDITYPNPTGQMLHLQDELTYDFSPNGTCTVMRGQHPLPDGDVIVENGVLVTDERTGEPRRQVRDAVDFLMAHPDFGARFWQDGLEPGRPLPTEQQFMAIVTAAAVELNPMPVQGLLEREMVTHGRAVLVETCKATLDSIAQRRIELGPDAPDPFQVVLPDFGTPQRPLRQEDLDAEVAADWAEPEQPPAQVVA